MNWHWSAASLWNLISGRAKSSHRAIRFINYSKQQKHNYLSICEYSWRVSTWTASWSVFMIVKGLETISSALTIDICAKLRIKVLLEVIIDIIILIYLCMGSLTWCGETAQETEKGFGNCEVQYRKWIFHSNRKILHLSQKVEKGKENRQQTRSSAIFWFC